MEVCQMIRMKTKKEQLQAIANEFMDEHDGMVTAREIAEWAIANGKWKQQPAAILRQCADEFASAMREEYIKDAQGRSIRSKHAARFSRNGVQTVLWADVRKAPRRHMEIAFQQRRQQIVGDCRQLKLDVDSYNANWNSGQPIQMVFNFTDDMAEAEAQAVRAIKAVA